MAGVWQIRESVELHLTAIADAMVRELAPGAPAELLLVAVRDGALATWASVGPPEDDAWRDGRVRFADLAAALGADGAGASTLVRGAGPDGQSLLVEVAVAGAPPAALLVPARLGPSRPAYWREGAFAAGTLEGAAALIAGIARAGAEPDPEAESSARSALAAVPRVWGPASERRPSRPC